MSFHGLERRFGITAVDMGLISADQLIEAMSIQIREALARRRHRPVGQILVDLGYLDPGQLQDVFRAMGLNPAILRTLSNSLPARPTSGHPGEPARA